MHSFIPTELAARMAELFPDSPGSSPSDASPPSKPHPEVSPATCEKSAPPPPDSFPPSSQPPPPPQVAGAQTPPCASFAEFTPPFIGATNLRRYRLRWDNFRRCWSRPVPQEPESD